MIPIISQGWKMLIKGALRISERDIQKTKITFTTIMKNLRI